MNDNQNKPKQTQETSPKSSEGATQTSAWKRLFAKKWVFPATYMAAAAIIVAIIWLYQGPKLDDKSVSTTGESQNVSTENPDAQEVIAQSEPLQWPVKDINEVLPTMHYFDEKGTNEEKEAAMFEYDNTWKPHVGTDFATADDKTFEVLAALGGKVTLVDQLPLVGTVVEISHENGLKTIYQSVADVKVKQGDQVEQGDAIAMAGRNELESKEGVHLHFEVQSNGKPVNPKDLMEKK